jgi:flagellar biosynthesis protein FlhB
MIAQAPQTIQGQLASSFGHFLNAIKTAFSSSLDHIFLISTILMAIALVVVFFLPEIKLRKTRQMDVTEVGTEPQEQIGKPDSSGELKLG